MKIHLIILTLSIILASCNKISKQEGDIKLSSNGDTLEVIKRYNSDSIREIIYYNENRPSNNIGFYENGDTIKKLDVVYSKGDSTLFAFIPTHKMKTYDILIGMDSIDFKSEAKLDLLHMTTDKLKDLKSSTTFLLPTRFVYDGKLTGVFRCKNVSSGDTIFSYHPFITKVK
jgi:hypothetical protein